MGMIIPNLKRSMYGIFTYIHPKNGSNIGKDSVHGASGNSWANSLLLVSNPTTDPPIMAGEVSGDFGDPDHRSREAKECLARHTTSHKS